LSAADKRALLARLLREKAEQATPSIPLSHGQRAMWFLRQLEPESGAYHEAFAWRFHGENDARLLGSALQAVVQRHPILRTTYQFREGELAQQVHTTGQVRVEEVDASTWTQAELDARLADAARRPFDLQSGPVIRLHLFQRGGPECIILTAVHHIAIDLWSMVVVMEDLRAVFLAKKLGVQASAPLVSAPYTDFVEWQAAMLRGPEGERLWRYWQRQLAGDVPVLELPTDRPRPNIPAHRGAVCPVELGAELTAQLNRLAKTEQTTLFATLLAAFQLLLGRYSGQKEFLVGSPAAGRSRPEFERTVGFFVNLLPLRANLSGNPTFQEFLGRTRQTVLGGLEHQDFPFPSLVERLRPQRRPSRCPLIDATFVLQKPHRFESERKEQRSFNPFNGAKEERGVKLSVGGLGVELYPIDRVCRFDLELEMVETGGALTGWLRYNAELFDATTIEGMVKHFLALLTGIAADPRQRIRDLPLACHAFAALRGRNGLQRQRGAAKACHPEAPQNPIEEELAAMWTRVLTLDRRPTIHENFFKLGGHSLRGAMLIAQINDRFHVRLPLRCLFEGPTIAELAQAIADAPHVNGAAPTAVRVNSPGSS
jgi:hypothetical protein